MKGKKTVLRVISLLMAVLLVIGSGAPATASASTTYSMEIVVTYGQTEARTMLSMVNSFRTGNDAWYWNEDNSTKTNCKGLGELQYDSNLERTAMLRAAEIAISYSHTRPNGKDCWTANSKSGSYTYKGENIAVGFTSASAVFTAWREDSENYSGQGHRRNMLDNKFNSVGFGHVYYNGTHFWVQEFGNKVVDKNYTTPADASTSVTVEVLSDYLEDYGLYISATKVNVNVGSSTSMPKVYDYMILKDSWQSKRCPITTPLTWCTYSDIFQYDIVSETITGVTIGTAELYVTAHDNKQYTITVTVNPISISNAVVTLDADSYVLTGSEVTPTVRSVVLNGKTLQYGVDYTISYDCNNRVGLTYVNINGIGNYTGVSKKAYWITAPLETETESYVTKDDASVYDYTSGTTLDVENPTRKGYLFCGWYADADYTTKIDSTDNLGESVYAKWKKVSVSQVKSVKLTNKKGKKLKITYAAVSGAKGYQISYATNKKFTGSKKKTVKTNSKTITGLTKNKKYYVRVRAYKYDSTGAKVYGKWSEVSSAKIKK